MSIYLSTRTGNLPRGCTSAPAGLGHEPLKRSVPFYSDNRAGIITDLVGSDSPYRVFKTQLIIPRCKMALSKGKGCNEQGTFEQSTFIFTTRMQGKAMKHNHTGKKAITGREQRHKQGKALQPNIAIMHSYLLSFTWQTAPQQSYKSKEMATPKDEGGRQDP